MIKLIICKQEPSQISFNLDAESHAKSQSQTTNVLKVSCVIISLLRGSYYNNQSSLANNLTSILVVVLNDYVLTSIKLDSRIPPNFHVTLPYPTPPTTLQGVRVVTFHLHHLTESVYNCHCYDCCHSKHQRNYSARK